MIQMLEIKTGSAIWEIDGTILRFQRLKKVGDEEVGKRINQYKSLLSDERYGLSCEELLSIAEVLGEVILLKIGAEAFRNDFFRMFRFYCGEFMEVWKNSEKYMVSNKVSMFPALHYMFYGTVEDTKACNLAALKELSCGKEIFQEIFREEFSNFWTKEIEKIVEQNGVLKTAADKIGNQMVTECMMKLQDNQIMSYLTRAAKSFTQNRVIITTQSYYHMIFGKKINMSRKKFFEPFVDKADQVIETEYALQCRKFPRENEKEMTGGNEIWKIFYMHGPTLFFQTVDFTRIVCPSLRIEVKSYMRCFYENSRQMGIRGFIRYRRH